jgi:hypothetical protein
MELTDPWQAQNIQDVTTKGFETQLLYSFNINATIWLFFYSDDMHLHLAFNTQS